MVDVSDGRRAAAPSGTGVRARPPDPRARAFALVVATAALTFSLIVLAGWATATEVLVRIAPSSGAAVRPWTAVLVLLCAIGLGARALRRPRIATIVIATELMLVGALLLVGIGTDWLDDLLFPGALDDLDQVGRPLTVTILTTAALGVSLGFDPRPRIARWTVGLTDVGVAIIGVGAISWAGFGAHSTTGFPDHDELSVPLIATAGALALGRLLLRPDIPPVSYLTRHSLGGVLSRAIASTLIATPIAVWLLLITGPEEGWWSVEGGAALIVLLGIAVPFFVAVLVARFSDRVTSALSESEARFRLALANAPIGMAIVSLDGAWLVVNPGLCAMFDRSESELRGLTWQELTHPDDLAADLVLVNSAIAGEIDHYRMEKRYLKADGSVFWGLLSVALVRDTTGTPLSFISQIEDVTERRIHEARLRELALHDSLTQLPNRSLLLDRLERGLAVDASGTAILYLDLDHFKVINDSLGHSVGDDLLKIIGARVVEATRPNDTVARLGGDEFAVLCMDLDDAEEASAIARRLVSEISKPLFVAERDLVITASVGIALARPSDTAETVLRNADISMYQAKRAGRNRYEMFYDTLGALAYSRFELEAAVRAALSDEQFVVHYQSQHELTTGTVVGTEALVRWQHPDQGLLLPGTFLPIAEEAGLMADIGERVLEHALRECGTWLATARPALGLSVNLAPAQLARPDFVPTLLATLERNEVEPSQLCLEMTESSLFITTGGAADVLRELADHGVRFAADDFGTGYASLSMLTDLPVTMLKIDQSFTAGLSDRRSRNEAVVRAIIGLGERLDVDVIAEGVETEQQAARLVELGCRYAQGFLYAHPRPADECFAGEVADRGGGYD
jgi:diguanylate cyclase (GGDEF)-like protein/PAS domain S-box-containing protein